MNDEKARKEAEEKGLNYDRQKLLHIDAIEAERLSRKKKKVDPNDGFSDFEQATVRQYKTLVKGMKPNMQAYEEQKEKLGAAFYGDRNTILHGLHKDKKEDIDRMVADLAKQYVMLLLLLLLFYTIFHIPVESISIFYALGAKFVHTSIFC